MFDELDTVVLIKKISKYGLKEGDIGTVVHVYKEEKAVEVEFVTAEGKTIALLTLSIDEIRPMESGEILHVRGFASM